MVNFVPSVAFLEFKLKLHSCEMLHGCESSSVVHIVLQKVIHPTVLAKIVSVDYVVVHKYWECGDCVCLESESDFNPL